MCSGFGRTEIIAHGINVVRGPEAASIQRARPLDLAVWAPGRQTGQALRRLNVQTVLSGLMRETGRVRTLKYDRASFIMNMI